MSMNHKELTRRDFLRGTASVTLAGAAGTSALAQGTVTPTAQKSKVVLVRDPNAVDADERPDAQVLQKMLDDAVAALLGETEPVAAWKRLVQPDETVGIKSNVGGPPRTPPQLEAAIKRRLIDAGVSANRIAIDDRGVLRNPIFQEAAALINTRPMRTHHWSGVGSLIKNYIMFSDDPPSWHGDSCANLAGLWDLPMVKGKTRLNILVMLTPLFHSKGPHNFQKRYTWAYKGLLVGSDPVAVDATGLRILKAKRRAHFSKDEPLVISPKHIRVAQDKFHLGIADPDRIDLKKLGWTEGMLI